MKKITLAVWTVSMVCWDNADGSVAYFDNLAAFQAAAGPTTLIDFDGIVKAPNTFVSYPGTVTLAGVTFSAPVHLNATSSNFDAAYDFGTQDTLVAFGGDPIVAYNTISINLPAATYAVAFDLANSFANAGIPGSFTVSLPSGGSNTFDAVPANLVFLGLISKQPISGLSIVNNTPPATYYQITPGHPFTILDNVRITLTSVPEPATNSMIAFCGMLLGAAHWRFRS